MGTQHERIETAIAEILAPLLAMDDNAVAQLANEIVTVRRTVLYGLGRELLALRAFGMRLVHHGFDAHIAGDVTALPVSKGDLVIVSAGPGDLAMAETMARRVIESGARLVVITAQQDGAVPKLADAVVVIPAQTMANDGGSASLLPMGTVFEIAMLIFLDLVAVQIRETTGQSIDEVRARHFNLE